MRALVLFLSLLGSLALGRGHFISTTLSGDFRNGPMDVNDLNRQFSIASFDETIAYRIEGLTPSTNLRSAVTLSHPDYDSILVRNRRGEEVPLSSVSSPWAEVSAEAGVDVLLGEHTLSATWSGSLSESPFSFHSVKLGDVWSMYSNATVLGVTGVYLSQNAPESYYLNSNGQSIKRPTDINGFEVSSFVEQTLTENWKTKLSLSLGQRIEERPANYGVSLDNAYALSDRVFAKLTLSVNDEFESNALKDERGYFDTKGAVIEVTLEPLYDLLLSVSYGLFIEREDDPRSGSLVQVASDQYGLGLKYAMDSLEWQLQGSFIKTNTKVENTLVSGGVTWRL